MDYPSSRPRFSLQSSSSSGGPVAVRGVSSESLERQGAVSRSLAEARAFVAAYDRGIRIAPSPPPSYSTGPSLIEPSRPQTPSNSLGRRQIPAALIQQNNNNNNNFLSNDNWPIDDDWREIEDSSRPSSAARSRDSPSPSPSSVIRPPAPRPPSASRSGRRPNSGNANTASNIAPGRQSPASKSFEAQSRDSPNPSPPPSERPVLSRPDSGSTITAKPVAIEEAQPARPSSAQIDDELAALSSSLSSLVAQLSADYSSCPHPLVSQSHPLHGPFVQFFSTCYALLKALPLTAPQPIATIARLLASAPLISSADSSLKASLLCWRRLFELSSNTANDAFVLPLTGMLIQALQQALVVSHGLGLRAIIYLVGALMNISMEPANQPMLCQPELVNCLTLLLDSDFCSGPLKLDSEGAIKLALEVTNVLRNIACAPNSHTLFVAEASLAVRGKEEIPDAHPLRSLSGNTMDRLCRLLDYSNQPNLLLNITRILSKLSLHQSCRSSLSAHDAALLMLVRLLAIYHTKLALCVRICFILGNITMQDDAIRTLLADTPVTLEASQTLIEDAAAARPLAPTGLTILLTLLQRSFTRDTKLRKVLRKAATGGDAAKHTQMFRENEDLLVKLIRLIANLSIHSTIGSFIAGHSAIGCLVDLLAIKGGVSEELILNTISAITNLSFYYSSSQPFLGRSEREILAGLMSYLFSTNNEILSETCRSLGNLSRSPEFRCDMQAARVNEAVLLLLDSNSSGVVYGASGVLLNLAADQANEAVRSIFFIEDCAAIDKLLDVIQRVLMTGEELSQQDLNIGLLVCKCLLNLRAKGVLLDEIGMEQRERIEATMSGLIEELREHPTEDAFLAQQVDELITLTALVIQSAKPSQTQRQQAQAQSDSQST